MHPTSKAARIAGAIYVALSILGIFDLMYVPSVLFVRGNATATVHNILAHETLFRTYVTVGVISDLVFIVLGLALYRLLSGVNKTAASLMAILVLVSATLGLASEINPLGALLLARGADFLAAIDTVQRDALAMFLLRLDSQFTLVNEVFWGLWLFPFGLLVFRSGFLPRALGIWLLVNGLAYLALSFSGLMFPQYEDIVSKITFPALLGEMAIAFWLLIMGARTEPAALAARA